MYVTLEIGFGNGCNEDRFKIKLWPVHFEDKNSSFLHQYFISSANANERIYTR